MRILGIDFGLKRVGVAISDEGRNFAFPKIVLPYSKAVAHKIAEICKVEEVSEVVLGESKDYGGRENDVMGEIRRLKGDLEAAGLAVYLEEEYGSSIEAARFQGKRADNDSSAAAIILQRFLDKNSRDEQEVE